MRTQRVLGPIRSIEEVQASLDVFGGRIAEGMDGRLSPPAAEGEAGGAAFSYRDVFDDLGRDLESLRVKVVQAEDEHVHRQARASALGRQTEELGLELYDQQVAARRILGGAFDPDRSFELAAISGITPQVLKALEEQVDQTVKLLGEPVAGEPAVKVAGVDVDLGNVAGGLAIRLTEFRALRADLDRSRKAVGESKVLLDRALTDFQGAFPWIAQALEAFARRVGERDIADRIRTSIRRVTRRRNGGGQAEPEPEPSAPAPSEETTPAEEPAPSADRAAEEASPENRAAPSTEVEAAASTAEP